MRKDIQSYDVILKKVFGLFGAAIHESLTQTMGKYLQVTGGLLANNHKSEWEREIAGRMTCTNNHAERGKVNERLTLFVFPLYLLVIIGYI
jgi:hypothetical protein